MTYILNYRKHTSTFKILTNINLKLIWYHYIVPLLVFLIILYSPCPIPQLSLIFQFYNFEVHFTRDQEPMKKHLLLQPRNNFRYTCTDCHKVVAMTVVMYNNQGTKVADLFSYFLSHFY